MKEKKMTIEDLAGLMENGFVHIEERFTAVDTELSGIRTKLQEHDRRFDGLDVEISSIRTKQQEHDLRLGGLDAEISSIRTKQQEHDRRFDVIDERYVAAERVSDATYKKIDDLKRRIKRKEK